MLDCRQFLLDRPNDVNLFVELFKAIKSTKTDLKGYFEYWTAQGASADLYQTLIQFAQAGARPENIDFYLQILASKGPNPQEQAKGEEITLLVKFTESGCTNEQIKAMFDLVTNKSANKELQQYFDTHRQQLLSNPKEFAVFPNTST